MTLNDFLSRLDAVKGSAGQFTARCPGHEDKENSLSVKQGNKGIVLKCHAGCSAENICAAMELRLSDLFDAPLEKKTRSRIVATYDYVDQDGTLRYQVVRKEPKTFLQRQPDPDKPGEWIWNLKGVTRILYNLPAVMSAIDDGKNIFLCEGEKDVESLRSIGLTATTNAGGAAKWSKSYTDILKQTTVIILPDNDRPGRDHARLVHSQLPDSVILLLPGLPIKGDVTNWIEAGGTRAALVALAHKAIEDPVTLPTEAVNGNGDPANAEAADSGGDAFKFSPAQGVEYLHETRSKFCTEVAAADWLCKTHLQFLFRYVQGVGWIIFYDGQWQSGSDAAIECAKKIGAFYRALAHNAGDQNAPEEIIKWLHAFSRDVSKQRTIEAILKLAAPTPGISMKVEEFDCNPMLVNCQNYTLDFSNIVGGMPAYYQHRATDYITKKIKYPWNPKATAPIFYNFLDRILPDLNLRNYVKLAAGYSILGITREQAFFLPYGKGANGKSKFINAISHVLGEYATTAETRTFTTDTAPGAIRDDLAVLRGVRFVSSIEFREHAHLDEAVIKSITGDDTVRARHLYKESFVFKPQFKLWLASNHKPRIKETDHAIWRRVKLIPFDVKIPEEEWDLQLEEKLISEAEGILAWLVEGAVEYLTDGLGTPEIIKNATENYRHESDLYASFLTDCCVLQSSSTVRAKAFHDAFSVWAKDYGVTPDNPTRFGRIMAGRFTKDKDMFGVFYQGVGLLAHDEEEGPLC